MNQAGKKGLVLGVILGVLCTVTSEAGAAFDAAQTFDKKCSSCHTIGGGASKGPDLKGISQKRSIDWIVKFVKSSAGMIASGDPDAVKIYNDWDQKDMPDQRLSDDEIKEIIKFIDSGGAAAASSKIKSAIEAKPDDIEAGRELFMGIRPLTNGGPACIACHSAGDHGILGGGTLAKDLTNVYSSYQDQGLSVALQKTAFPVMQEIFSGKSLTDEEVFQLKSFFLQADREGKSNLGFQKKFFFLGLGGLVIILGFMDLAWRNRRKSSVRRAHGGIR